MCVNFQGQYFIRNFQVDSSKLPSFTLDGIYRVHIIFSNEKNEPLIGLNVTAVVKA